MKIAVWIAGFLIGGIIGGALGFGAASIVPALLMAQFSAGWYEGPDPAPPPLLSDYEQRCMRILQSQGVDATAWNRNVWSTRCFEVYRGNAMGNCIGYTEYTRRRDINIEFPYRKGCSRR